MGYLHPCMLSSLHDFCWWAFLHWLLKQVSNTTITQDFVNCNGFYIYIHPQDFFNQLRLYIIDHETSHDSWRGNMNYWLMAPKALAIWNVGLSLPIRKWECSYFRSGNAVYLKVKVRHCGWCSAISAIFSCFLWHINSQCCTENLCFWVEFFMIVPWC